ncbi:MAG TPA: hypothetical protein VJN50_03500 [Actinomycetota bacterium]|nr:hypothetical protein [Actinomycetota bacterium]
MTSARALRPLSLHRGAMKVIGILLLSIAFVLAALGIPVPFRVPSSVMARRDTEAVTDKEEPDDLTTGRPAAHDSLPAAVR